MAQVPQQMAKYSPDILGGQNAYNSGGYNIELFTKISYA